MPLGQSLKKDAAAFCAGLLPFIDGRCALLCFFVLSGTNQANNMRYCFCLGGVYRL
jgi:hypothetical protein